MVGGAWVAATACWLANCESAEANTSSRKKKDKKKASAAGGTGPSLTKNSEKVSECVPALTLVPILMHGAVGGVNDVVLAGKTSERRISKNALQKSRPVVPPLFNQPGCLLQLGVSKVMQGPAPHARFPRNRLENRPRFS